MFRFLSFFLLSVSVVIAEEVMVYRCETTLSEPLPNGDTPSYSSPGEELGKIETGKDSLVAVIQAYEKDSWKAEPFYGPVEKYVFKDSQGKLFVVHFEFKKDHPHPMMAKGTRFAILPLTEVAGAKGKYTGSPYDGSSISDEGILKQLREIAHKKPGA